MKIKVIAIGKLKSRTMAELVSDYSNRLSHYVPFELTVVKSEDVVKVDAGDYLVVCDEQGHEMTSQNLANFILMHQNLGTRRLVFFIGDAIGVGQKMKGIAKKILSLSKMTFPHELARVILAEQLYRACTILRGERYHYG